MKAFIHTIYGPPEVLSFGDKPDPVPGGSEFAGRVASIGKNVTLFKTGDRVFGFCVRISPKRT